eukprot:752496-Pleurochrysis_carterae.AAC.1
MIIASTPRSTSTEPCKSNLYDNIDVCYKFDTSSGNAILHFSPDRSSKEQQHLATSMGDWLKWGSDMASYAKNAASTASTMVAGTELEKKLAEATSNEPWGASGTMLSEISQATFNYEDFKTAAKGAQCVSQALRWSCASRHVTPPRGVRRLLAMAAQARGVQVSEHA